MALGSGEFRLYSRIEPPLQAGDYRFSTNQAMRATGHAEGALPVEQLDTHVRIRSPQYQLPTDQVLSTFPPAGREGSFGARLPQIVIRRRTLPWERAVRNGDETNPWLALVLIAENEAELRLNRPVADCVTNGVVLDSPADAERGNCLAIRKSMVDRIFPTQEEVALLAHAREVDINDTELMMGDDDGFLAVVISNRLPLPGRDADGNEVPVKYLACLVNLCEQFDSLLPSAPDPLVFTTFPSVLLATGMSLADQDHVMMGRSRLPTDFGGIAPKAGGEHPTTISTSYVHPRTAAPYEGATGWVADPPERGMATIYEQMAQEFTGATAGVFESVRTDPELVFPVLIHWSFTSCGDETFESLMKGLDSALLGHATGQTVEGRPPLEVVETGHVGLAHRTRRGDPVRSWYRGPLLPHPADDAAERLKLAHAADQVRIVVPDGREDLSLAAAFEIGRLLGLSRPSMVAALMRWRQLGYQAAHRAGTVAGGHLADIDVLQDKLDRFLGGRLGAMVAEAIVRSPADVLGNPNPLVNPGREVLSDHSVNEVLSTGFAIDRKVFSGGFASVIRRLQETDVRVPRTEFGTAAQLSAALTPRLDARFSRAAVQAISPLLGREELERGLDAISGVPLDLQHLLPGISFDTGGGLARPHGKGQRPGKDALDRLIEDQAGARAAGPDDEEEH